MVTKSFHTTALVNGDNEAVIGVQSMEHREQRDLSSLKGLMTQIVPCFVIATIFAIKHGVT